jgi:hypothetical protein
VRLLPDTRIERPNHEGITASDLRVGWQVEVDAREESGGFAAKKVKVKNRRNDDTKLEGVIESDGNGGLYLSPERRVMSVRVDSRKSAFEPGIPRTLFEVRGLKSMGAAVPTSFLATVSGF